MRVKLKDVCTFYTGTGFPKKYQGQLSGTYPFYKVGDIANNVVSGKVYLEQCNNYISEETLELIKGSIIPKNTIVFAKIGEALKLNRRAITSTDCLIDNNAMGIAAKSDKLRTLFFYYFMRNIKMELLAESTTVPSVRKSRLEAYEIDIPSLDEQKIIEGKLTILSKVINLKEKQLLKLDELVKARFVEMFGEIEDCDKWESKIWNEVVTIKNGRDYKKVLVSDGGYPVVGTGGEIARASKYLCPENTIVVGRKGSINNPMLMKEKFWNVDTAFGVIPNSDYLHYQYFYCFCKFYNFMKLNKATTLPSTTKADLLKIRINIPPLELQNQFASFVQEIDKSRLRELLAIKQIKLLLHDSWFLFY